MTTPTSGRLTADHLLKPAELNRDALRRLITVAEAGDWKLVDWERFGTPALDRIVATIEGPAKGTGRLVDELFAVQDIRSRIRDIFPRGIPVIDRVRIAVEVTPGLGR
jgi:hypothetical protein